MTENLDSGNSLGGQFRKACSGFDIKGKRSITALANTLEHLAQELAQSGQVRTVVGSEPAVWTDLRKLWRDLSRTQLTFWDGDDSENEEGVRHNNKQADLTTFCIALAKFTRNLVAGISENQNRAFENEPDIRRLLHYYTSWSAMKDSESLAAARVLTQALSNLVTANEMLVAKLWDTYMNLPEDQVILIRLLGSPDPRTLLSSLIFILNCIHDSSTRIKLLTKATIGARVCVALLDDMLRLYDADEGTEGAQAFDVGYEIFTRLMEEGLIPDLYQKFAIVGEIVTPHQTTLLKLVDSYLQSIQLASNTPIKPETLRLHSSLGPFLAKCFFSLSAYAQRSIARALGSTPVTTSNTNHTSSGLSDPHTSSDSRPQSAETASSTQASFSSPSELDVMLPKVCEALVLVTQCIVTIALDAEEIKSRQMEGGRSVDTNINMKFYFNDARFSQQGLVESLIELLRLLDLFLPRINFGKPVHMPAQGTPSPTQNATDSTGFSYLKRDLVRLLGVLCHDDRAVQDRIRDTGGIPVVMNLCVVDERNPYLREHALFTLRNILKDNTENQKLVDSIKPSSEWDESGTLKSKPGAVRK
ncbi:spinocerebellar ataxia type 10 protein domain-containing protein [Crucibulum laeve]|uniref:Ataxin-10 homolog n=1 Tax=Crucibulum laeve TaxID=68775 RepID=A0A5C3M6G4_9AGAR|nr:spinocerebellar ataxia type 10 protein domain-containing protein [Crucibulum laeve]